jgi:hypothetical protein
MLRAFVNFVNTPTHLFLLLSKGKVDQVRSEYLRSYLN